MNILYVSNLEVWVKVEVKTAFSLILSLLDRKSLLAGKIFLSSSSFDLIVCWTYAISLFSPLQTATPSLSFTRPCTDLNLYSSSLEKAKDIV